MTFSDYLATRPSLSRAYLPPASYEEMMEWILEPDDLDLYLSLKKESPAEARRFLRGGFFREFLIKYPESDHLHKRMLLVSREAARHQRTDEAAVRHLYRGQGNDPYWHGVFGGLYLPHLREAAYHHLLEAEKRLPLAKGWRVEDYDLDGRDEVLYRGEDLNLFLKPSHGGAIVEIDDLELSRNLSNVLSRRQESYHRPAKQSPEAGRSIHELARELPAGHETLLRYDWHPRYSLLDHILHPRTTAEDFTKIRYGEQGDFVNQEYKFRLEDDGGGVALSRHGHVWVHDERKPVEIRKTVQVDPGRTSVLYELANPAAEDIGLFFANEWNLSLHDEEWVVEPAALSLLKGRWRVEFAPVPDGIWHFPLETLSQSENGYDIIRQGRCFLPYWKVRLGARETISLTIQWTKKR